MTTIQLGFGMGAEVAKIHAIDRVEAAADPEWKKAAYGALVAVAAQRSYFTSDHVWERLQAAGVEGPREPRAMGAIFRRAVSDGRIRATGRYEPSGRVENHARPVAVWESVK